MAIRVKCQHCSGEFTARDEFAGKRGKCPKCQAPIVVPVIPRPAKLSESASAAPKQPAEAAGGNRAMQSATPLGQAGQAKSAAHAQEFKPTAGRPRAVVPHVGPALSASTAAQPSAKRTRATTGAGSRQELARQLLGAFRGDIHRVRVPLLYRVGILIAAAVMIILPAVYVALIAAAGWGVYYHAANHTEILEMGTGRGRLVALGLYVGPIVVGGIMVLFMLKPLFARPTNQRRTRSLTRQAEPVLFSFVERICKAVGSREPVRIEVDNQMNAAAGFDAGIFKLFRNRLVLTIGVPLVAGLDTSQFAGVLAHEFGHFTQGAGLRVTYIVRSINAWFVRVVYERDAWDEWLEETAGELDFRVGWILQLARVAVFLSRRVLWLLMMIGHVVSGFMLRQMEFHADAHEARLVGAKVFESTTRQLTRLDLAHQVALSDLGQFVDAGKLPDNLPRLVLARSLSIPSKLEKTLNEHVETAKTGWFDTHPAPQARIRRAARERDEPVFADERPASQLFSDFQALSRGVTADLYRGYFGSRFQPSLMFPTEELLQAAKAPPSPPPPPLEIEI